MSYIGKEPQTGAYSMLDSLSASATASYSLTLDSVAFVPESANHLLVSLNGVIQKAGSSYTVSGSTLTFSSALTSSDSIDFVLALGNVLDIGTPSDATVTNAKTNFVSTSSSAGLDIKGDGTTDGTLRLLCSQGTHGVKIASPAHSAGQSYTLTLPTGNVTADKFLKVASVSGSGTTATGQLSFADAGGGRATLLSTTTLSSSASYFDMTDVMSDTYNNYLLVFFNGTVSNDGSDIRITFFSGSGTSGHLASADEYRYFNSQLVTDDTDNRTVNTSTAYYQPNKTGIGNASDESFNGEILLYNARNTSLSTHLHGQISYTAGNGHAVGIRSEAIIKPTNALTGLRFELASGNMDSGTFKLYGLE